MTIHEFAHAYMAHRLGDPTPRLEGRLSLNPVAHIDPMGLLMLVFFRFGWGRSVEVNPRYFRDYRKGLLWVSLAGPASNLALGLLTAILFGLLGRFVPSVMGIDAVGRILRGLLIYNVYLAVFNLVPIPPLDGSKILFGLLPARAAYRYLEQVGQYGSFLLLILVFTGAIGYVIGPVANAVLSTYIRIVYLFF